MIELTQPQGHSSSGSHERYKSKERLDWELEHDCIVKMQKWLIDSDIATAEQLKTIEEEAKDFVRKEQRRAWSDYNKALAVDASQAIALLSQIDDEAVELPLKQLQSLTEPSLKEVYSTVRKVIRELKGKAIDGKSDLLTWYKQQQQVNEKDITQNCLLLVIRDRTTLKWSNRFIRTTLRSSMDGRF